MRIFSQKAFQFDHPENATDPVIVQYKDFATVPDWVKDSTMFQYALADNDIQIILNKGDELAAETGFKAESQAAALLEKETKSVAAKAAVAAAESEPNQLILDEAYDLVNDLPNGTSKTSLIKKLGVVADIIANFDKKPE